MIFFRVLAMLPWFLLVSSCSTIKVSSDYDENISFQNFHTYTWLPNQPKYSGNPVLDSNELLHARIKKELNVWFQSHGYNLTQSKHADFLVGYLLVTKQETQVTVLNDYYGYPGSWGYRGGNWNASRGSRAYVYDYEIGTLVIDIIDTKTHQLIWRGTAEDEIKALKTPDLRKAKIAEVIKKVMAQFPPA